MIHSMASKTEQPKRPGGMSESRSQAGWKHIGADIPPTLYDQLSAAAKKDSVPQAAVIRWALADYFAVPGEDSA